MKLKNLLCLALFVAAIVSCSKDDGPATPNNSAPVIVAQTFNVSEDITDSEAIGKVEAEDGDGDELTFSITANDNDLFAISTTGSLGLAAAKTLDFETKTNHAITVKVSDGEDSATAQVTINVSDKNDVSPVFGEGAYEFGAPEDIDPAEVLGTVTATDVEGSPLEYGITENVVVNDNALFEIDPGTGEIGLADGQHLDFETAQEHVITVSVSDGNSQVGVQVTITVANVNDVAPVFEEAAYGFAANEDVADTFVIGTVLATDEEGDELEYGISVNDNALFEIDPGTGEISLANGQNLDFENIVEHVITVSANDGVAQTEVQVTVTVNNVMDTLAEDPNSFVTTWQAGVGETIVIGTYPDKEYDFAIDWGDGTLENLNYDSIFIDSFQHTYENEGIYTVAIQGTFPHLFMGINEASHSNLLTIEQWGANEWDSMRAAFRRCNNVTLNAMDVPNLINVTDMSSMFNGATNINGDLSGWNTENVLEMDGVFAKTNFNGDISGWKTDKVTTMIGMFNEATKFDGDLSEWNTENVTNMNSMFVDATSFRGIGLSGWNTDSLETMIQMFWETENFNEDISGWNTANVFSMKNMFYSSGFNHDLGSWDISSLDPNGIENMFGESSMSPENYSATLAGWATLDPGEQQIPQNLTLEATGINFCNGSPGAAARTDLINNHGWTIEDEGGIDCQ